MALRIAQLEEIHRLLLATGSVADAFDQPDFVDRVIEWLREAERVLEANRLHVVSQVAQARIRVLAARRGIVPPGVDIEGRRSARKIGQAAASQALTETTRALEEALSRRHSEIEEAEGMARQIVAVARVKGFVPQEPVVDQRTLEALRARVSTDEDLLPLFLRLSGLVTRDDTLVLLDRARA